MIFAQTLEQAWRILIRQHYYLLGSLFFLYLFFFKNYLFFFYDFESFFVCSVTVTLVWKSALNPEGKKRSRLVGIKYLAMSVSIEDRFNLIPFFVYKIRLDEWDQVDIDVENFCVAIAEIFFFFFFFKTVPVPWLHREVSVSARVCI